MKKLLIFKLFFSLSIITATVQGQQVQRPSHQIDAAATASAPWKVGSLLVEESYLGYSQWIYRKFLGMTSQGHYLVQDFYKEGNVKLTDPYIITHESALKELASYAYELGRYANYIDGPYIRYHNNGQKWMEYTFQNGIQTGTWKGWQDTGQQWIEGHYENGKKQGLWTHWHRNGNKSEVFNYVDGKTDGLASTGYVNGNKRSEYYYKNGKFHGPYKAWYSDGKIHEEGMYKDGEMVGKWLCHRRDGRIENRKYCPRD